MTFNRLLSTLYYIGMIVLIIGVILKLQNSSSAFWVYSAGCIPVLGIRIYNLIIGRPENKRKHSIMVVSALVLAAGAYAIYMDRSYWIIFIAISAVLDFYISFRRF